MHHRLFANVLPLMLSLSLGLGALTGVAFGQEDDDFEQLDETAIEMLEHSETLPRPDDDVMRPTTTGFRITPDLVRFGTRQWVEELTSNLDLTEAQAEALTGRVADQVMKFAHDHAADGHLLLETLLEAQFAEDLNRFSHPRESGADRRQELGRQLSEMTPALRELFRHVSAQARPVLNDAQWDQWREDLAEELGKLHRLEANARRWAEGNAREGERIGDLDKDPNAEDGTGPQARRSERRQTDPLQRARRNARREVDRALNDDGRDFLNNTREFFGFDESQTAEARQLLAEYQADAEAIKTPEFREALMRNRVKFYLRWYRPVPQPEVWEHFIDTEYKTLFEPWKELSDRFKSSVIALATIEQREAALAEVRRLVLDQGLSESQVAAMLAGRFEP